MSERSIYWLRGPTAWAGPPDVFSFSSLRDIEQCPLKWQLLRSQYGDLSGFPARPNPAAVEGEIVHEVVERLFKAMGLAGFPAPGTERFRATAAAFGVLGAVRALVDAHEQAVAAHPRGGGFRLRSSAAELANRAKRLFRAEYTSDSAPLPRSETPTVGPTVPAATAPDPAALLESRGVLSAVWLRHPRIPYVGVVDLVHGTRTAPVIVEFKTGAPNVLHRQQLIAYALLWWRRTGQLPVSAQLRYPARSEAISPCEGDLASLEGELEARITSLQDVLSRSPGEARPGEYCRLCDVRQFCDAYWAERARAVLPLGRRSGGAWLDVELIVTGTAGASGLDAVSLDGMGVPLLFAEERAIVHGPFEDGEVLRVLSGRVSDDGSALEVTRASEVFHVGKRHV